MTTTTDPDLSLLAHPDAAAFRARICREPKDDTVRGAFADWLDENGDPEWAAYIRAAIELARGKCFCTYSNHNRSSRCAYCADTESLLPRIEPRLRRGLRCGECEEYESGSVCPACSGRGWLGVLGVLGETRKIDAEVYGVSSWLIPATWSRGFVSAVTCPLAWWQQRGRDVVKEWPVTEINCTDEIWVAQERDAYCWWEDGPHVTNDGGVVSRKIFQVLWEQNPDQRNEDGLGRWLEWETELPARSALSSALRAWAWWEEPC